MLERQTAELIANIHEPFRAAILAGIVALLRIMYDGQSPDKAQTWKRDDPTLMAAAAAFGLTESQIDALASTL